MAEGIQSDLVSFEDFYKIVRPSFHKDFDEEDLMGIFKRACFVVFTEIGVYVRHPGTITTRGRELLSGRTFLKEIRPELAGIEGTTIHYFDGVTPTNQ